MRPHWTRRSRNLIVFTAPKWTPNIKSHFPDSNQRALKWDSRKFSPSKVTTGGQHHKPASLKISPWWGWASTLGPWLIISTSGFHTVWFSRYLSQNVGLHSSRTQSELPFGQLRELRASSLSSFSNLWILKVTKFKILLVPMEIEVGRAESPYETIPWVWEMQQDSKIPFSTTILLFFLGFLVDFVLSQAVKLSWSPDWPRAPYVAEDSLPCFQMLGLQVHAIIPGFGTSTFIQGIRSFCVEYWWAFYLPLRLLGLVTIHCQWLQIVSSLCSLET